MRIAYIISAYKLPEQLVRLVQRLNYDDVFFFIHVDKKTHHEIYQKMVEPLSSLKNVVFLKRHVCYWGNFGHVRATLKGIYQAKKSDLDFDYYTLLTGQDYPIKTNRQIMDFFTKSGGKSFINFFTSKNREDRLSYYYINNGKVCYGFPKEIDSKSKLIKKIWNPLMRMIKFRRKLPSNLIPYFGSSYWSLSKNCVEYIFNYIKHHKRIVQYFKSVLIPDEAFFQTILANSPQKSNLVNDDLFHKIWPKFTNSKHPDVLTTNVLSELIYSDKLFARKFDCSVDSDVLDMIDRKILGIWQ